MRKKSTYVILIVILLLFFLIVFYFFGLDSLKKEKDHTTLIVGNRTIWTIENRKWKMVPLEYFNNYSWKKFRVFLNQEEKGDYDLWFDDNWYFLKKKKKSVLLDGDLLAYQSNHNVDVYPFEIEDITNLNLVYSYLDEKGISTNDFTSFYQIPFDFDNDGNLEMFYVVSNAFPIDFSPNHIFSLVFMEKNDIIYPIYTDISKNEVFNGCKPYFYSFLDIDMDRKSEFILSCSAYSVSSTTDMLYQFNDDQFQIVISNQ